MKKITIFNEVIDRMKKIITIIFLIIFLTFTSSTPNVYSEKKDYDFEMNNPPEYKVDTIILKVRGEPKIKLTLTTR